MGIVQLESPVHLSSELWQTAIRAGKTALPLFSRALHQYPFNMTQVAILWMTGALDISTMVTVASAVNRYVIGSMSQYIYDTDGVRVGKGSITSWSCDITSNGFRLASEYIPRPSGEQMTGLNGQGDWVHTNAYAGGQLARRLQRVPTAQTGSLHKKCR
jgi:hypothetical protein